MYLMNTVKIIMTAVKVFLTLGILQWLSKYIFPLQILFCSNIFLLFFFQSLFTGIYYGSLKLNELPFIGFIYVFSDYIVLSMFEKNE